MLIQRKKNLSFFNLKIVFYSLMYFNSKLTGTAQERDNSKNMYLHVGQLRKV